MENLSGSIIKGNILYSKSGLNSYDYTNFQKKPFIEYMFEEVSSKLKDKGDVPWLTNGVKGATGSSKVFGPESVMLSEIEARSRSYARVLFHNFSISRGDVVHLVMPNNADFYFPVFGSWILQGVVSPADPALSENVLSMQFKDAGTKLIFCSMANLDKVISARNSTGRDIPVIVMDMLPNETTLGSDTIMSLTEFLLKDANLTDPPTASLVEENERVMIVWSSGTTGQPKGIQHGNKIFLKYLQMKDSDVILTTMITTCMYHLGGFVTPIKGMIDGKHTVFVAEEDIGKDIAVIYKVLEKYTVDAIVCGSHHGIQLASSALPTDMDPVESVKFIMPVGTNVYNGIKEDLLGKFPSMFGVMNIYGQSECGNLKAMSFDQSNLGGVFGDTEAVKIVIPGSQEALGPNMIGEISYKSNMPMIGYLNHPEENDKFFGKDGFLYSGDFGHYDENGILYFDGRIKELIKYKNSHLYPNEIEELILAHPDVEDAAVFGKPEPTVQELVTAVVVKKATSALTSEDVINLVQEQVDDYKRLRGGVYFVDKVPRNPQGKVLRKKLIEVVN